MSSYILLPSKVFYRRPQGLARPLKKQVYDFRQTILNFQVTKMSSSAPPQNEMEVEEGTTSSTTKSVMASSGTVGSVSVSLHPLVIMNISEHWTRIRSQEGTAHQGKLLMNIRLVVYYFVLHSFYNISRITYNVLFVSCFILSYVLINLIQIKSSHQCHCINLYSNGWDSRKW